MSCEHEWIEDKSKQGDEKLDAIIDKFDYVGKGRLVLPVKCKKCGKKMNEVWKFSHNDEVETDSEFLKRVVENTKCGDDFIYHGKRFMRVDWNG